MSSTDFSIAIGANISDFQAGMVGVRNSVSNAVNNINAIGKMTTALTAMKAGGAAAGLSMATLATGILAVVGAVAAAGAYWYADAKEEEAARLESHIAETERLNAVTEAVENAATFEELEEQLKAAAQAWEIYAASREKNGIKGGLVKDGFDASVEAAAEKIIKNTARKTRRR